MMKFTTTLCALACVSAGPLRLRGNTAGRQRKLLDFSFSPSLSGSDSVSTGNMVRGSINQVTLHGEGNTVTHLPRQRKRWSTFCSMNIRCVSGVYAYHETCRKVDHMESVHMNDR